MATFTLRHHITGLRRDASSHITGPDCQALQLLKVVRQSALTALGDVPAISHADQYRLIDASLEVGQDETQEQQGDESDGSVTAGTLDLVVRVQVPDEIAYAYNVDGSPLRPFIDAVQSGLAEAFLGLPNNGADLAGNLGFGGATLMFASSVKFYGHD